MNKNDSSDINKINDLIDMIDKLMSGGGGHINVFSSDETAENELTVQTFICTDCGCSKDKTDKACNEPTLYHGIDDDDNDY